MDHTPGRLLPALARLSVRHARAVVLFWVAFVAVLTVLVPRLETVVADDDTPVVPFDAPSIVALQQMDAAFGNGRTNSVLVVVVEREGGLTASDLRYYRDLVPRLRAEDGVAWVQDVRRPVLRRAFVSDDGEAAYVTVGLPGATGAPASLGEVERVREIVATDRPGGLRTAVTGGAGTIADMALEAEHSILRITLVTVLLIGLLLLVLYRSVPLTLLVLGMIAVALGAARAVVAALGAGDLLPVSTFTGSFMTAVVLGAATDYAIFLIARFHEARREGVPAAEAAVLAGGRVAGVIVGSALTVVLATAAMGWARLGVFTTTGPAVAVALLLTLAIALTLVPAVLALAGGRGWLDPRGDQGAAAWDRTAGAVVARPARVLALTLVPILALAALAPVMDRDFDSRASQPASTESNRGYRLLDAHFPVNETLQDWVLITADHDLRTPDDLAALEAAGAAVAAVPGVVTARGLTRPRGEPITQASVSYQAGVVGRRLGRAADRIRSGGDDTGRLASGAGDLADGADELAGGTDRAATASDRLAGGLEELDAGLERLTAAAGRAQNGSARLRDGAAALAAGLDTALAQTRTAVDGLGQAVAALDRSLTCRVDPQCSGARAGLHQLYDAQSGQLVPGLADAATAAHRIADGTADLQSGLVRLRDGLDRAQAGADRAADGQRRLAGGLGDLAGGASQLATGSAALADGTDQVVDQVDSLGRGLGTAAQVLRRTGGAGTDPAVAGFYLPPSALKDSRLDVARAIYLSADGRTARIGVLGATDAFGTQARSRIGEVADAARTALRGTSLADAEVTTAGTAAVNADLASISAADFGLVAGISLIAVFLVLLVLLRSLVAAGVLLASVVVSYAAALGIGVLAFQVVLGRDLDWSVPVLAFILLVAVGSDYNMLLMKRMQEEAPDGDRAGIARATSATGRVITAAGLIFAASMFALLAGSVSTIAQTGFTIGAGLLLDTFVVRSLVIPAIAALLGPRLWWPRRRPATVAA
ncbi:RND transporter MmpL12 [Nocardioides fonticola]|uniref:RND transporter MmpL12 n=1 Tax=Nocardioides fonticola TaxID=450363 RepID=A0ABP7XTI0_9ACTN